MKIQYASDLHLEFPENDELLKNNPLKPEGDILVLAGDIVPLSQIEGHTSFFDYLSGHFKTTWWVPGNHEYYHSDITERGLFLNEKIRENVFLVNNLSVRSGNVNFLFSTLWTRINPIYQYELRLRYSDFHVIRNNGRDLTVEQYNRMHESCLSFLKEELGREKKGITIVVTHHMPTFLNYSEEVKKDAISEAFAVELSDLIEKTGPDYWIFGHDHTNQHDFNIGRTRLVTNQLGYVMYNEHKRFNAAKTIVV
jgi:predicted phosphohydrolase